MFTNADNGPLNKTDSYTLTNVRVAWKNAGKDLTIALEGTNVTDEYYLQNRFDVSGGAGAVKDLPGRSQEWALVVRKSF